MTAVKICGLSTPDTLDAALEAGADMVGFVFFNPSPRNVALDAARELGRRAQGRAKRVALTVDADDETLASICAALAPDVLQLHGSETLERVAAIRARTGLCVWKAIGVRGVADLANAGPYEGVADMLLLDAKPPRGAVLPGGNGKAFDWTILRDERPRQPWMLSGGLHPGNVEEALSVTGANSVDVSSGVERSPGVKDAQLIRDFIARARRVSSATGVV